MRNFTIYLALLACLFVTRLSAQETFESKAKAIAEKIEAITKEEKEALKKEVELINEQLDEGSISPTEAEAKKKELAEIRATNIETRVAVAQQELQDLVKQKVDGKIKYERKYVFSISFPRDTIQIYNYRKRGESRTTSQFVFAAGLNNLISRDENFENTDFRVWGSHFYEWGVTLNTRIFKNNNLLHAKYGFSVMYNNLRPTDNRYFVKNGNQTDLVEGEVNFRESRFRNVFLVAPAHLEFDFTPKKVNDEGKAIFRTHRSFRVGLGGYAGIRVKSKQILKYEEDDVRYKIKQKGDFNVSNFIYGLSAYVGYDEVSLYLKYDLNPMFKNNTVDQNNISLGVRFDFN